jgi:hypothetical protein
VADITTVARREAHRQRWRDFRKRVTVSRPRAPQEELARGRRQMRLTGRRVEDSPPPCGDSDERTQPVVRRLYDRGRRDVQTSQDRQEEKRKRSDGRSDPAPDDLRPWYRLNSREAGRRQAALDPELGTQPANINCSPASAATPAD